MATKTNFYFSVVTNTPAQISIKHVKFTEQIFDISSPGEIMLSSFTSWTLPSRFLIKNLSTTPISIDKINFNIPTIDNVRRPIKLYSIKRNKELIVDFHEILIDKPTKIMPFVSISLDPNTEYQIKFSGYMLEGREYKE